MMQQYAALDDYCDIAVVPIPAATEKESAVIYF